MCYGICINRDRDRLNRIESPEMKLHMYEQLIFHENIKASQCKKGSRFLFLSPLLPCPPQQIVLD